MLSEQAQKGPLLENISSGPSSLLWPSYAAAGLTTTPGRVLAGTAALCAFFICFACPSAAQQRQTSFQVTAAITCMAPDAKDQDDMCVWLHPHNPEKSTIITSDKKAGRLFVYDLSSKILQSITLPKPGNVDTRRSFPLGGKEVDIVAVNQRKGGYKIRVFAVDSSFRTLHAVDSGGIPTGKNYGGCLYHSCKTGNFYFITTSKSGFLEQYRLFEKEKGGVSGRLVRSIPLGPCEGIVAHDESGTLYVSEEEKGIWAFGAEPEDPAQGKLIAAVGKNGLTADIEGLTICRTTGKGGYLIASSQGSSTFCVYRLTEGYPFAGSFTVEGVQDTDGIDVLNTPLDTHFPHGLFACHNGRDKTGCPVMLVPWEQVAGGIGIPFEGDTASSPSGSHTNQQ